MFARLDGRQGEGHVGARRSQDKDRVDVGFLDHLVVVLIDFLGPEEANAGFGARIVEVADGTDHRVLHAHHVGQIVGRGHNTAADDADLDFG